MVKGKVGQDQDLDTYSRECVPFTRYSGGNVVIVGSVVVTSCNQGVHGVYILSMAHCSDVRT